MKNILLIYHSGTGTTKIIVDIMKSLLNNNPNYHLKVYRLPEDDTGEYHFFSHFDLILLLYPCYYFDASTPVLFFLNNLPFFEKPIHVYQIVTRSLCTANTIRKVVKRCAAHNLITTGYQDIRTPGVDAILIFPIKFFTNYQKSALKKMKKGIVEIRKILSGKGKKKIPLLKWYSPFGYLFIKFISRQYQKHVHHMYIDDDCINCNKCIFLCSFKCWESGEIKPKRTKADCILCLNCIHKCPQKAVLYNKKIKNKPRFIQADYDNWKKSFMDRLSSK